jgi:flagellin
VQTITVTGADLTTHWPERHRCLDVTSATALADIETAISTAGDAAAPVRLCAESPGNPERLRQGLGDALSAGVGSLVDANMQERPLASALSRSQQQLGVQSLSIANQAPQSILPCSAKRRSRPERGY